MWSVAREPPDFPYCRYPSDYKYTRQDHAAENSRETAGAWKTNMVSIFSIAEYENCGERQMKLMAPTYQIIK
jgi:hypothetical protein